MIKIITLVALCMTHVLAIAEDDMQSYHHARLVEHEYNDGDSFFVDVGDQQIHLRLYFVDCPESFAHAPHDARRIQEQARYFGISEPSRIVQLGEEAAAFAREVLSKPFTVHTAHARALGGQRSNRVYGFIETSDGEDFGELLVRTGRARNFGVSRQDYRGMSLKSVEAQLRDLEISAMLARRGIWASSDSDLIVKYRAEQRREQESMHELMTSATRQLGSPLNVNTADAKDLERIPGIGPVMAGRIIEGRPYSTIDDLKRVPGIGEKTFDKISPYLSTEDPKALNG